MRLQQWEMELLAGPAVGLAERTATTWIKLAKLGLTPEEVIERGGINAAVQGFSGTLPASRRP